MFQKLLDRLQAGTEEWNSRDALRELIKDIPELARLYHSLGYSPLCEEKVNTLMNKLLLMRQLQVDDPAALSRALGEVRVSNETPDYMVDRKLLQCLVEARESMEKVRAILELGMSSHRSFYVIDWRLPWEALRHVEVQVSHHANLGDLLDDLERTFDYGCQSEEVQQEVLTVINKFRQALQSKQARQDVLAEINEGGLKIEGVKTQPITDENVIWPHLCEELLETAEKAASEECHQDLKMQERREQLDDVLQDCLLFRHKFGPEIHVWTRGFQGMQWNVRAAAQKYMELPWAHSPWLRGYVTATLLMTEIAPLAYPKKELIDFRNPWFVAVCLALLASAFYDDPWSWTPWLGAGVFVLFAVIAPAVKEILYRERAWLKTMWDVCEELDTGSYDGEALARRLQSWEGKRRYAPSIVYSLLQLPTQAASAS